MENIVLMWLKLICMYMSTCAVFNLNLNYCTGCERSVVVFFCDHAGSGCTLYVYTYSLVELRLHTHRTRFSYPFSLSGVGFLLTIFAFVSWNQTEFGLATKQKIECYGKWVRMSSSAFLTILFSTWNWTSLKTVPVSFSSSPFSYIYFSSFTCPGYL